MTKTIAYIGPEGSFSESVCFELYPKADHPNLTYLRQDNLTEVFNAVCTRKADLAVLPVWNSIGGFLKAPDGSIFMEKIAATPNLRILQEKYSPLKFRLIGLRSATLDNITTVHTNEYTHQQCEAYFAKYPKWLIKSHPSSSKAAEAVSKMQNASHAAMASEQAAQHYGLQIIDSAICSTGQEPIMRFLVLERHSA